jgi:glycosyltransferase involved in cell wall biosynthesis
VASRVAGLRDAIVEGETGELFEQDDLGEMVAKVTALLRDRRRREELGAEARRWAESFSWDAACAELEAMLEDCVEPVAKESSARIASL